MEYDIHMIKMAYQGVRFFVILDQQIPICFHKDTAFRLTT